MFEDLLPQEINRIMHDAIAIQKREPIHRDLMEIAQELYQMRYGEHLNEQLLTEG